MKIEEIREFIDRLYEADLADYPEQILGAVVAELKNRGYSARFKHIHRFDGGPEYSENLYMVFWTDGDIIETFEYLEKIY